MPAWPPSIAGVNRSPALPVPDHLLQRARALRQESTDAERYLWSRLRNRALGGLKVRRQVPVGPSTVDSVCAGAGLPHPSPLPLAGEGT
jgi:hypothetical protein